MMANFEGLQPGANISFTGTWPNQTITAIDATVYTPQYFGAVGNGVTNDTTAVQSFLTQIAGGGRGDWNGGNYLVTEGSLTLQSPSASADAQGPIITGCCTLTAAGTNNSPILTVQNQTQPNSGSVYAFYRNGDLGAIKFYDPNSGSNTSRHGLSISGCFGWKAKLWGQALQGALWYVPLRNNSGAISPDYYECADNDVVLYANKCKYGIYNQNNVDGCGVRATTNFEAYTVNGSCVDSVSDSSLRLIGGSYDNQVATTTSTCYGINLPAGSGNNANRVHISDAEMDTCYTGCINLGACTNFKGEQLRMTMRQVSSVTYPTQACLILGNGGTNDIVKDAFIRMEVRLSSGVTSSNKTAAIDGTSSQGIVNTVVYLTINDQTGGGFSPSGSLGKYWGDQLIKNISAGAEIDIYVNGYPYILQRFGPTGTPTNQFFTNANSATPSVEGIFNSVFRLSNTSATTITNFTNGRDGQFIICYATNGNTSIANNGNIKTLSGSTLTLSAEVAHAFYFDNAVLNQWVQIW